MIERTGFLGRSYTVMEWITKIAYLNILWFLFTFLGLILFGIGPASVALFTITRSWVRGEGDVPITATFWQAYRKEFIRGNLLIWPFFAVSYILFIDFQYMLLFDGILFWIFLFVFINVGIIFIITLLYIFPLHVHFDLKWTETFKKAFVVGISNPLNTFTMVVAIFLLGLVLEQYLGLVPFFSISLIGFIIMWFAHRSVQNVLALKKE